MIKIKTKVKTSNKYVFVDTSVFLDVLYSDTSSETLDKIIKELNDDKIILILPQVILKEIEKEFKYWKRNLLDSIEKQLSIELILNVTEKEKTGGKDVKKRMTSNSSLIDKITKEDRKKLLNTVSDFYKELEDKLNSIFNNKNTKKVELSTNIILKGIERSLLKKAPGTKLDKKTEHQHLKDVDCIAFESLLTFFELSSVKNDDVFYLITDDGDYRNESNSLLREELMDDLSKFRKTNIKYNQSIDLIFTGKSKKKTNGKENIGSLFGSDERLVESSEKHEINSI